MYLGLVLILPTLGVSKILGFPLPTLPNFTRSGRDLKQQLWKTVSLQASNFVKIQPTIRKLKMLHFFHFFWINRPPTPSPRWSNRKSTISNLIWSGPWYACQIFIVLAYLEVPKIAKPGPTDWQTDRPTEFAIAICHLVNSKCHKNVDFNEKR